MRCGKARKWLSAEIDGELPAERKVLLERHLSQCGSCVGYRERLLAQQRALGRLELPQASTAFRTRLSRKLARVPEHSLPSLSTVLLRWVPVTVILAAALFLGGLLGRIIAAGSLGAGDEIPSGRMSKADELGYFTALPRGGEQDLFGGVTYQSEEDLP